MGGLFKLGVKMDKKAFKIDTKNSKKQSQKNILR